MAAGGGPIDDRLLQQPPRSCRALWNAYVEMSHTRPPGGTLLFTEIEAWQRLHNLRLSSWEVETLIAIDRSFVAATKQG